jgi:PKD repeat protein
MKLTKIIFVMATLMLLSLSALTVSAVNVTIESRNDGLYCFLDGVNDENAYAYVWHRNQESTPAYEHNPLPASRVNQGDAWTCTVYAKGPLGNIEIPGAQASVLVGFEQSPLVTFFPTHPQEGDDVTCLLNGEDDTNRFVYAWKKAGTNSIVTENPLQSSRTTDGDVWTCKVYAKSVLGDVEIPGAEASVGIGSASVIAGEDTTAPSITLQTPEDNAFFETDTITFTYEARDDRGLAHPFMCSLELTQNRQAVASATHTLENEITQGTPFDFIIGILIGGFATEDSFTVSGLAPGDYQWAITCTDVAGNTAVSEERNFTVTEEPVQDSMPEIVKLSADPILGQFPLDVHFESMVTGGDGDIAYSWRFGDGASSNDRVQTDHTYLAPGTYSAQLTVFDEDGDNDQRSVIITVTNESGQVPTGTQPVVSIQATPTQGLAPLTVDFTSTVQGGDGLLIYDWDFNDGSVQIGLGGDPQHTFAQAGLYTVTLTVTDEDGESGSDSVDIIVDQDAETPYMQIVVDAEGNEVPLTAHFSADIVGFKHPISYAWDFDDRTTSSEVTPTHVFERTREYLVELVITDREGNTFADFVSITPLDTQVNSGKLSIQRIVMEPSTVYPGDYVMVSAALKNNWHEDLEDVKFTAIIPELGVWATAGTVDIDSRKEDTMKLIMDVPYDALAGEYEVWFTASNDQVRRVTFRPLTII